MYAEEITYAIMPEAIEIIIMALCSDYFRRNSVIESQSATYRVIMEYRFLNHRIYNAAAEIAGERDAVGFIRDIGCGNGYAKSSLSNLTERVYKMRKKEVKYNIAKRLSLFE